MKMQLNLKLSHKGLLLVAIPLLFELTIFIILVILLQHAERDVEKERRSRAIVEQSNMLLRSSLDAGVALYMFRASKNRDYLKDYQRTVAGLPQQIAFIESLLRDSPDQQEILARLDQLSTRGFVLLARAHQMVHEGNVSSLEMQNTRSELVSNTEQTVQELRRLVTEQSKQQVNNPETTRAIRKKIIITLIASVWLSILLAIGLAMFFNAGTIKRLKILIDNTSKLARAEALNPPIAGSDEIAHLDNVFHQMANDLADANQRKQELVAIVSHDLRTPLTSIRAALTLLSSGVFGELPPGGQNQIEMAERSAVRLIKLINDLLDVEKLDATSLQLKIENCSLNQIIRAAIDSTAAYAQSKEILIALDTADISLPADAERLTQVLVNLLSNAIKFSPPHTTIQVTPRHRLGPADLQSNCRATRRANRRYQ
jgi:signal transduction histidine kinase